MFVWRYYVPLAAYASKYLTPVFLLLYTLLTLSISMARIEFPSIPIGAKPEPTQAAQTDAAAGYSQLTLEGLLSEPEELLEFGNCLVTSAVTFRKRVKGNQ